MERISKYLPCWMPIHRIAIEAIKKHRIALDTYHIPLPSESEASYRDTQNVWESSTKTDFSLIHIFFESHKLCECCPKALQSHRRHHIQTCIMCERVLRKPIFHGFLWFLETTKCVSVARKHTKAIWSIISRQAESVREVYENPFFIDSHPQHHIYRRHSSVWVLSETRLNNKTTRLVRHRFIVVIWILLPKVLVLITRNECPRHRLLHQ